MNTAFNQWWDESPVNPNNPYTQNTPAYWAWEGWCAGVKAEREACAKVCDELANDENTDEYINGADWCSVRIRARSNP